MPDSISNFSGLPLTFTLRMDSSSQSVEHYYPSSFQASSLGPITGLTGGPNIPSTPTEPTRLTPVSLSGCLSDCLSQVSETISYSGICENILS